MKCEVLTDQNAENARLRGERLDYWDTGLRQWFPRTNPNKPCSPNELYRIRPKPPEPTIDPGDGYRLLGPDEVIQEGDEFFNIYGKQWEPTSSAGCDVKSCIRSNYRRRITPPAPKLRDFGPCDIRAGCEFALKSDQSYVWYHVAAVRPDWVCLSYRGPVSWAELREHWLIRYPNTSEFVP